MIALESVSAARSSAVPISGLPAALPRTPSNTLGVLRPCAEGCDCTFVQAAIALVNIIPTTSAIPARRLIVIDQLPYVRIANIREISFRLIPAPIDQNRCAHWRSPMDMMRQG